MLFSVPFCRTFIVHRAQQPRRHKPTITPTLRVVGAQLLSAGCVGAAEFPVLTAHSPALARALGKAKTGRNQPQRMEGTKCGGRGMAQPPCLLPVALAWLLKNTLLEPDQPQPSKTELMCSSHGRRTGTKPSPRSAPRSPRAPGTLNPCQRLCSTLGNASTVNCEIHHNAGEKLHHLQLCLQWGVNLKYTNFAGLSQNLVNKPQYN